MKIARYIPTLLVGAGAALSIVTAIPAIASTDGHDNTHRTAAISTILRTGDIVTGVRGTTNGNVVLTGSAVTGSGMHTLPFLYRGHLTAAAGAAVSVLAPAFPGVTSATFYGPDTHSFNPTAIRRGQVRAVGSYQSSSAPAGVLNQGMIYLGRMSGSG